MPGKWDIGFGATRGQGKYFPGSREGKAWDAGFNYRYTGDGTTTAQRTDNPFNANSEPVERQAWFDGWDQANAATATDAFMPFNRDVAPTPP